ncbi:hypothetical protein [Novosphingobium sp.]|uniref:hypothetical protein n=1 Tax=Novosphingobium sp. TaxID=1874826 RepID=UPI0035AF5A7D
MNLTRDRLRSIGWAAVLLICFTLLVALTFRVNAVKSQVRLAERQIVSLKQDKMLLETEFETRANQQQLRNLNDVEFGYSAPTAGQYLEGERQLAALGKARGPNAPSPIRVASAETAAPEPSGIVAMVSPLTGKAMAAEAPKGGNRKPVTAATLGDRLSHVDSSEGRSE